MTSNEQIAVILQLFSSNFVAQIISEYTHCNASVEPHAFVQLYLLQLSSAFCAANLNRSCHSTVSSGTHS